MCYNINCKCVFSEKNKSVSVFLIWFFETHNRLETAKIQFFLIDKVDLGQVYYSRDYIVVNGV